MGGLVMRTVLINLQCQHDWIWGVSEGDPREA